MKINETHFLPQVQFTPKKDIHMMVPCHFCFRLFLALVVISVGVTEATTNDSATESTSTIASTTTMQITSSTPVVITMSPTTAQLPTTTDVTSNSTNNASTTAQPTNMTTPFTMASTTLNATNTPVNTTGSVSVTTTGNSTTLSPSQNASMASPNSTVGPQDNATMQTSPSTPTMTSAANNASLGNVTTQALTTMSPNTATPVTTVTTATNTALPTSASTNMTNSTTASPTEPATTTTTTKPPTTTTALPTSFPTVPLNTDGFFVLNLTVGPNSTITCVSSCTDEAIRNSTQLAFRGKVGFYDVRIVQTASRRKRDVTPGTVKLQVRFVASSLLDLSYGNVSQMIRSALQHLNQSDNIVIIGSTDSIVSNFTTTVGSVCNLPGVCVLGYTCLERGGSAACYHLCDADPTWNCGEHGTCQVVVMDGKAEKSCKCDSDYDNVWSGDKCQDSDISGEKKARIAGGVLGAFCGVFIIIIIVLIVKRGGCCGGGGGSQKYHMAGVSNAGYSDISMQKM